MMSSGYHRTCRQGGHGLFTRLSAFIRYLQRIPHPILDVVVDDEIQLLVGDAVMAGEDAVNFVAARVFCLAQQVELSRCRTIEG